jgi:hypothetical protein
MRAERNRREKNPSCCNRLAEDNETLFIMLATDSRKQMTEFRYPNRPRIAAEGRLEYFKRFANHSSKPGTECDSPKLLISFINFDYSGARV